MDFLQSLIARCTCIELAGQDVLDAKVPLSTCCAQRGIKWSWRKLSAILLTSFVRCLIGEVKMTLRLPSMMQAYFRPGNLDTVYLYAGDQLRVMCAVSCHRLNSNLPLLFIGS